MIMRIKSERHKLKFYKKKNAGFYIDMILFYSNKKKKKKKDTIHKNIHKNMFYV